MKTVLTQDLVTQLLALHQLAEGIYRKDPTLSFPAVRSWVHLLAQRVSFNYPCATERLPATLIEQVKRAIETYPRGPFYLTQIFKILEDATGKWPSQTPLYHEIRAILEHVESRVDFERKMELLTSIVSKVGDHASAIGISVDESGLEFMELFNHALANRLPAGQSSFLKIRSPSEIVAILRQVFGVLASFPGLRKLTREDWLFFSSLLEDYRTADGGWALEQTEVLMSVPVDRRDDLRPQIQDLLKLQKVLAPYGTARCLKYVRALFQKLLAGVDTVADLNGVRALIERVAEVNDPRRNQRWDDPVALFRHWKESQILTPATAPVLFSILFSELLKPQVVADSYVGDTFPRRSVEKSGGALGLHPIEEHPKVKEILGGSHEDRTKELYLAMHQHPSSTAWIKELVKNSSEAGAKKIALDFSVDPAGHLMMNFTDDGIGVASGSMHAFFIPKFSTKEKASGDINFGWGFFTLFQFFDEVVVESSPDGTHRSLVHLKLADGKIQIQEATDGPMLGLPPGAKGTRISGRVNHASDPTELAAIVGHLADSTGGLRHLAVDLNGKSFEFRGEGPFPETGLLAREAFHERYRDGTLGNGHIEVYQSTKPGVYYGDQLFSDDLSKWIPDSLPASIRAGLVKTLAIRLDAKLQQNAGRTGFLNQSQWQDSLDRAILRSSQKWIENRVQMDPGRFPLPSDYFWDFTRYHEAKSLDPHELEGNASKRSDG